MFSFGHVKFEVPSGHLSGDVKYVVCFRVHGRGLGWKYKFGYGWESRLFSVVGA